MPRRNPPLPRSFFIHIFWIAVLCFLLFALIGLAVLLTGGRDFGKFTPTDWQIFWAIAFAWVIDLIGAFYAASTCGKGLAEQRRQFFLAHLHEGVDPADDVCVLADYADDRRALIRQDGSGYVIRVEGYQDASAAWQPDGPAHHAATREDVLRLLEDEWDFCPDPEALDRLPCKPQ